LSQVHRETRYSQSGPPAVARADFLHLDATDDALHRRLEGRFFHRYYDGYCYLPLYIFWGRHLLASKLRGADVDAAAEVVEESARISAWSGQKQRLVAEVAGGLAPGGRGQ
jgi:hypothetical protein